MMQKGFAHLLLIFIVILALASASGIYWFKFKNQSLITQDKMVPPLPPSPSPVSQAIIDEKLGLNFSLPAGLSLKQETEEEYFKRANGQIRKNFTGYIKYPPAEFVKSFYILNGSETDLNKAVLSVWAFKNPDNLTPEEFYKQYWYYPFVWGDYTSRRNDVAPVESESIAGKNGESGVVTYRPGKPKFIYLPIKDKELMLQIQYPTEASGSATQILDTFQFN